MLSTRQKKILEVLYESKGFPIRAFRIKKEVEDLPVRSTVNASDYNRTLTALADVGLIERIPKSTRYKYKITEAGIEYLETNCF